jgi:hypothetical protein
MDKVPVKNYLLVSGTIFGLVSLAHLYRVIYGLGFNFGSVSVPVWASWLGFVFAGALCGWAFNLARK